MVWFPCCLDADDHGHHEEVGRSTHRNGSHGLIHVLSTKFAAIFKKEETPALPEANPNATLHPSITITSQAPSQPQSSQTQLPEQVRVEEVVLVLEIDGGNRCKSNQGLSDGKQEAASCYIYPPLHEEDEEECPTCLEEYTSDNPKIISNCNHHFHLVCIYEWMKRSQTCPVCGQAMIFEEKQ